MNGSQEASTDVLDEQDDDSPGIIADLGTLGRGAVIQERGMMQLFGRSSSAIKRAVIRGELPKPTRLFGKPTWTVGMLIDHLEGLQRAAIDDGDDDDLHDKELRLRP